MFFGNEVGRNPLNPLEMRARSVETAHEDDEVEGIPYPHSVKASDQWLLDLFKPLLFGFGRTPASYTLTVGDVCFVAIGQIVGRPYRAVRYLPTAIIIVNSPTREKRLRELVRAQWSSDNPAKMLFQSLLIDYATEGIFNGESLGGWGKGSDLQVKAALRLLYYFPKETVPLIAARLRSLDVQDATKDSDWMKREGKNRVPTVEFIKAVAWCTAPAIDEALADIAKRTNDRAIKKVLEQRRKKGP